jgi:hypothetical protein
MAASLSGELWATLFDEVFQAEGICKLGSWYDANLDDIVQTLDILLHATYVLAHGGVAAAVPHHCPHKPHTMIQPMNNLR